MRTARQLAVFCAMGMSLAMAIALAEDRQDSSGAITVRTDDVVVTATRFEEAAGDQPIGTEIFTGDEIRAFGVRSLPEFLLRSAGIYTRDNTGSPNRQIDMRGFGITGDQNTLILVDGQRVSENQLKTADLASIPLTSIDRIEIMRGSGAVLYGGGASAGTINIITRGARAGDHDASLTAGYGTYDTRELAAAASIANERAGASVHLAHYASDNYRDNNELEQQDFQSDLRWFAIRGPVYLKINVGDQDLRLPGSRTEQQLVTDRRGTANPNDFSNLHTSRVNLGTELTFGTVKVGVNLTHRERDDFAVDGGGSIDINGNDITFSPRVRVPFLFGVQHELVAGIDLDQWEYATTSVFQGSSGTLTSEQSNSAVFVKDTLAVGSATRINLGARTQRVDNTITDVTAGTPAKEQKRDLQAWEIALRQSLTGTLAVYAKTGTSFRVANIDENRFLAVPLEPQTSRDSEIGLDYESLRGRMRAAAYHMDIENEIGFVPGDLLPPFGSNVNLPPTLHEGVELEAYWALNRSLNLGGQYSYTVAKFKEGSFGGADVAGNNIPLVPRHRAGISASVMPLDQLRITGTVTYVGEQYYDNDQSNSFGRKMPAYTVTDLSASYDIGRWTLEGVVRNLFNELYYSYAIRGATTFNAYPAAERAVLVSARYRF